MGEVIYILDDQPQAFPVKFNIKPVADPKKSFVKGFEINSDGGLSQPGNFVIYPIDNEGNPVQCPKYEIEMKGPQGLIPLIIDPKEDGTINVKYDTPLPPGDYEVIYILDDQPQALPVEFNIKPVADPKKSF